MNYVNKVEFLNNFNSDPKFIDEDKKKTLIGEYFHTLQSAKKLFKCCSYEDAEYLFGNCFSIAKKLNDKTKYLQSLHLLSNTLFKLNKHFENVTYLANYLEIMNDMSKLSNTPNDESVHLKKKTKILLKLFMTNIITNNLNKSSQCLKEILERMGQQNSLEERLIILNNIVKYLFDIEFRNFYFIYKEKKIDKLVNNIIEEIQNLRSRLVFTNKDCIDSDLKNMLLTLFSKQTFNVLRNFLNEKFYIAKYYQPYPIVGKDIQKVVALLGKNLELYKNLKLDKFKVTIESLVRVNKINIDFKFIGSSLENYILEWKTRINFIDDIFEECFLNFVDKFLKSEVIRSQSRKLSKSKILPNINEGVSNNISISTPVYTTTKITKIDQQNDKNIIERKFSKTGNNFKTELRSQSQTKNISNDKIKANPIRPFKKTQLLIAANTSNNYNEIKEINLILKEKPNSFKQLAQVKLALSKSSNNSILNEICLTKESNNNDNNNYIYNNVFNFTSNKEIINFNNHKVKNILTQSVAGKKFLISNLQKNSIKLNDTSISASTSSLTPSPKTSFINYNLMKVDKKQLALARNNQNKIARIILKEIDDSSIKISESRSEPTNTTNIKKKEKTNENILNKLIEYLKNKKFDWFYDQRLPNYVTQYCFITKNGKTVNSADKINQDSFFILENYLLIKNFYFFGVCDGHGANGHLASDHAKNYIPANLLFMEIERVIQPNNKKYIEILNTEIENLSQNNKNIIPFTSSNIIKYMYDKLKINVQSFSFSRKLNSIIFNNIVDAFDKTHEDVKLKNFESNYSGTTVCSVFIYGKTLYCANLGDSRAIIACSENGNINAFPLSNDHKPDNLGEKDRILKSNGRVEPYRNEMDVDIGPARVWLQAVNSPGLAMSRSIGDCIASRVGVISTPEISEYTLRKNDKFIIIASDGIWEFISNQKAVDIVTPHYYNKNPEDACRELLDSASKLWRIVLKN